MESKDFFSIASQLIELCKTAAPIIIPALLITAYLWTWKRSGSGFFILQRLLFIVGGSKKISNERIDDAWQKVYDFYSIRLRTGIKFLSNSNIEETIEFLEKHKIGLEQIIPIRSYFNTKECEILDPKIKRKKVEYLALSSFLLIISTPFILLSIPNHALLTVKETKTSFWTNGKSAYYWNPLEWSLDLEACPNHKKNISNRDAEIICELLSQKNNSYVANVIFEQRIFGSIFLTITLIMLTALFVEFSKAKTADELRKRTLVSNPEQLVLF